MKHETPGKRLRTARQQRQWSQADLAKLTGIPRGRLSHIENDRRQASLSESETLQAHLKLLPKRECQTPQPFPRRFWRLETPRFQSRAERPVSTRLNAAHKLYGQIVNRQLQIVMNRSDRTLSKQFLEQAGVESAPEMLFWLHLLAAGGKPGWVGPQRAGFRTQAVVDPDSKQITGDIRHPCLDLAGPTLCCLIFPQLTLAVRHTYYRLDALAYVRYQGLRRWVNIEVDGQGHDPTYDAERQQTLGLLTVRLESAEVGEEGMLASLERKLVALFPAKAVVG